MSVLPSSVIACCALATLMLAGCNQQASKESPISAIAEAKKTSPETTELSLREFYKFPIGPRGLEPTEKLLRLNGKRVQVTGYMVKEEEPTVGLLMLAPLPVSMAEKEDGPADDLPAATLFVHPPIADKDKVIAYKAGLWRLTGILELGNREESNGRMSYTRLILD